MKLLKSFFVVIAILYILGCTVLYFTQEAILFNPHELSADHQFRTGLEVKIPVTDDVELSCLLMKDKNPVGAILYLHGQKGNIRRCIGQAKTMAGQGYDILLLDYRGFGKSDGQNYSEQQMFDDVQVAYDYLKKHYDENKIVVAGYSLGTGMASYLASVNNPEHLIMVAPYVSLIQMKNKFLPFIPDFLFKYKFSNKKHLENVKCPVTMIHGLDDTLIPQDSDDQLKAVKPDLIQSILLPNTGHRGVIFCKELRDAVGGLR